MKPNEFPDNWDEERVQSVIASYEQQTEDEVAAEDEAAFADNPSTVIEIFQTDSIQELAQFWDTHDSTDFEDEFEEVTEPIFGAQVTVRLNPDEAEVVKTLAKNQGTSPVTLVQEWVAERIATSAASVADFEESDNLSQPLPQ